VYEAPRELVGATGMELTEMPRHADRSLCCGAGGARMWMEEKLGERINVNRTQEAVGTGADQIAVGCPFCRVMLSDGLTAQQASGDAREEVEVLDVAQMLLASVKGVPATRTKQAAAEAGAGAGTATATLTRDEEATAAEPAPGDATRTEGTLTETSEVGPAARASGGGGSLFDLGDDGDSPTTTDEDRSIPEEAAAAKPEGSGGSLFDLGSDDAEAASQEEQKQARVENAGAGMETDLSTGGSLFDLGGDDPDEYDAGEPVSPSGTLEESQAASDPPRRESTGDSTASGGTDLGAGGSLFDVAPDAPTEPEATAEADAPDVEEGRASAPSPSTEVPEAGSLFDIAAPEPEAVTTAASNEPQEPGEGPAEQEEDPKPTASGPTHQPRTDADIDDSGSLFDL
ncbi:MAG TPA: heterodisulfide reductase-related iron-sulfur binding cluster, partial [Nocardioides sp.]|nr:heterodisulfide reductase-related iron-sulfur binding cluster [Nocardioides sp.]